MVALAPLLEEKKTRRLILYFVFFYFAVSQWHRLFWHGGGKQLLGDPLNFLWIPAFLYLILWMCTRRFPLTVPNTLLDRLILLFLGYVALQFLWADDVDEHLRFFLMLVQLYLAYWFVTSALCDEKSIKDFLILVLIVQTILAFISLTISYVNKGDQTIRPLLAAFGGTSSTLGMSLLLSLSFALPLLSSEEKSLRLLSFIVVALIPAAIVGTTSRAPTIAGFVPFLLALPFLLIRKERRINVAVAYAIGILLSLIIYERIYSERSFLVPADKPMDEVLSRFDHSFGGRRPNWEDAISDIEEAPVFGRGVVRKDYGGRGPHPHNEVLFVLCRFGVLGTAVFFSILATVFLFMMQLGKREAELPKMVSIAAAVFIAAHTLYSIPECFLLLYFRLSLLHVFFLAVFTAVYRLRTETIKSDSP